MVGVADDCCSVSRAARIVGAVALVGDWCCW